MADVFLDGARVDYVDTSNDSTIGELMVAIEARLVDRRRFILELWVDGKKLDDCRKTELLSHPIAEHTDFEFKTVSIETLALEGVDMVQKYIHNIRDSAIECVRSIRLEDGDPDAPLSSVIESLVDIVKTMDALTKGVEKYRIALFRESPLRYFNPMLKLADRLADLSTSGEHRAVAEHLDYEVVPMMNEMERTLFYYADRC